MKKNIFIALTLSLALAGCGSIVARKDESQVVKFESPFLHSGKYNISLYELKYPRENHHKDMFFKDFTKLSQNIYDNRKNISIILPYEAYMDILNSQDRQVREDEKTFFIPAFSLTQNERDEIDRVINVATPRNSGSIQIYLNKQVAYWYDYLGRKNEYDPNMYYTELDKEKLVDEIFVARKNVYKAFELIKNNLIISVDKNVDISTITLPIYFKDGISNIDFTNIKSNVIVAPQNSQDRVIPDKILLIDGKAVTNVRDFEFNTKIVPVQDMNSLALKDDVSKFGISDLENFEIRDISYNNSNSASVKEEEKPRETIRFNNSKPEWRID